MTLRPDRAIPDAARSMRSLELAIARRLEGMLQGDHAGLVPGPGWEAGDGRAYQPGDDVRRIDWSLSARSGDIQVRDTIADRELETWVVIDGSASLDFGTDEWAKRDLAIAVAATFGFLSCTGGSRFGLVVATPDGIELHPAGSGRDHVRRILRALEQRPAAGEGTADLAGAVERIRRIGRRPGVVVLVTDLLDDGGWDRPMRGHAERCHTIVVEVRDRREDELPAVGLLTLVDPETGALREVQTADRRLRERFAAAAAERRVAARHRVRSCGARHLVLRTDRDWLADVVRFHLTARAGARGRR